MSAPAPLSPHAYSLPAEENEEDGVLDFASLMPNFFSGAQQYELDFQDIHRLLTMETSKDEGLNPTSFMTQALASNWNNKGENNDGAQGSEIKKNTSPSVRPGYLEGKENAAPNKTSERRRPLRRERSSRSVSHRRPFVVDLRSFGSIMNKGTSGDYKNLKDVHAFWEAAEEQEASEAIMRKVRGENCSQKFVSGRRPAVRRKNSQRTTTRLKGFTVELPSCAEQMKLVDEEQLEEEEDGTDESCFTFLKQPEVMNFSASQDQERQVNKLEQGASVYPDGVTSRVACDDESLNVRLKVNTIKDTLDHTNIIMRLGKDSEVSQASEEGLTSEQLGEALSSAADSKEVQLGAGNTCQDAIKVTPCDKHSPIQQDNGKWKLDFDPTLAHIEAANTLQDPIKVTPCNDCSPMTQTPLTTPTPPSNPIAAYGLRKDSILQQDVGKRKLDFDTTINSSAIELPLSASTKNNGSLLFTYMEKPENLSQNLDPGGEVGLSSSNDVFAVATKNVNQNVEKSRKRVTAKRRRDIDRRDSLEGAGTKWDGQVRRSTRIRSRPLDWWRGERFLKGRIHKSLVTVIGIKYSSPPPCWPKRGAKLPDFKVESFVSEDYARYLEFAALC